MLFGSTGKLLESTASSWNVHISFPPNVPRAHPTIHLLPSVKSPESRGISIFTKESIAGFWYSRKESVCNGERSRWDPQFQLLFECGKADEGKRGRVWRGCHDHLTLIQVMKY